MRLKQRTHLLKQSKSKNTDNIIWQYLIMSSIFIPYGKIYSLKSTGKMNSYIYQKICTRTFETFTHGSQRLEITCMPTKIRKNKLWYTYTMEESACNVGDPGLIPGLGRSPGEGNGNPLQYSCLENPMDRGAQCRLLSMGS